MVGRQGNLEARLAKHFGRGIAECFLVIDEEVRRGSTSMARATGAYRRDASPCPGGIAISYLPPWRADR